MTSFKKEKVKSDKPLLVLVPAISGTRIGPQRIFVEIAREVAQLGFDSFRMDMGNAGDAIQHKSNGKEDSLISLYDKYLNIITSFFNNGKYAYKDYLLLSISIGCEPVLKYAIKKNYSKVIFLSPTYLDYVNSKQVNSKNLKAYYHKIFKKATWVKLMRLNLNWKRIYRNIIPKKTNKANSVVKQPINSQVDVYSIYGELDLELKASSGYWAALEKKDVIKSFKYDVVSGSDHSFFGYRFKKDLKSYLLKWLSSFEWKN